VQGGIASRANPPSECPLLVTRAVYLYRGAVMGSLGVIQLFGKLLLWAYAGIVLWSFLEAFVMRSS
jgi:hypothetical protein